MAYQTYYFVESYSYFDYHFDSLYYFDLYHSYYFPLDYYLQDYYHFALDFQKKENYCLYYFDFDFDSNYHFVLFYFVVVNHFDFAYSLDQSYLNYLFGYLSLDYLALLG